MQAVDAYMKKYNKSPIEFCAETRISYATFYGMKNGRKPRMDTIKKIEQGTNGKIKRDDFK